MFFLAVRLLNGKVCDNGIAIKPGFELRNGFHVIRYGKFCSGAPVFNVVYASPSPQRWLDDKLFLSPPVDSMSLDL